ncbi:MAG: nucleotidyltransferase family protein [Verrucomicrobiota bacterium]|jgi:glucose-1-phosphate thymidylyltransferase|nr:nucleotidyltransferase family protein [Chthoniobacterales bacterium]MBA3761928.1 nucleotidyltransferase family protein [Chthoniobacterales bacterium]MDQ3314153.1 nucleotidyltransferase family protein [Verrucomicrobiota bacterium]
MNVLILAAGYATRLYPLTLTKAKPLLEIAGKPMIEWVLNNLAPIPDIQTVYVVTNSKFAQDFQHWADSYQQRSEKLSLKVINDGSKDDADKLGAIGDINLVLLRENLAQDDLIIVAGDNLFSEPLTEFAVHARGSEATLATFDVGNLEAIKKYSAITTDADGIITSFEEKPAQPKSTLTGIALYYFSRETVPLFTTYIAAGNNPDQPGRFIQWLYQRKRVKTYQIKGTWFDIGSKETLEEANELFKQFRKV